jgi:hypothetical protein
MRRLGSVLATLLVTTALMGGTVGAGVEWCDEDPVFNIRGTVFRVTTSIQASASDISGLTYDVVLPSDAADVTTVAYPQGKRLPTTVNVSYTGAPSNGSYAVSVSVTVSGPAGAAVRLAWAGPSVTEGTSDGSTGSAVTANFTAAK